MHTGDAPFVTTENALVGTPLYLAPEVLDGEDSEGGRDMYALGGVGYFLLTGTHVFEAESALKVCAMHATLEPVSPSERLGDLVPEDLERLILELLAKSPEDRPDAPTMLKRLEQCSSCGSWSQTDAQTWWQHWGPRLRESRRSDDRPARGTALTMDVGDRVLASPPRQIGDWPRPGGEKQGKR